jgi:hypothetical protein
MATSCTLQPKRKTSPLTSWDILINQKSETRDISYRKYHIDFSLAASLSIGWGSTPSRTLPSVLPVSTLRKLSFQSEYQQIRAIKTFTSLFFSVVESFFNTIIFDNTLSLPLEVGNSVQQADVEHQFIQIGRSYSLCDLTKPDQLFQLLTYEQDGMELSSIVDELCQKSRDLLAIAESALAFAPEGYYLDSEPVEELEFHEVERSTPPDSPILSSPCSILANLAQDAAESMSRDEMHEMYLVIYHHIVWYQHTENLDNEPQMDTIQSKSSKKNSQKPWET